MQHSPTYYQVYKMESKWEEAKRNGKLDKMIDLSPMIEELESESLRADWIKRERRELWTATLVVPQLADEFKPDVEYHYDSCGDETYQDDEDRLDVANDEHQAKETDRKRASDRDNGRYLAQNYVDAAGDEDTKSAILRSLGNYDEAGQALRIKELYFALVRAEKNRKLLDALKDFRAVKKQRQVVMEAYEELADPDVGAGYRRGYTITDLQKYRAEVEKNCAEVNRQIKDLAAAESGRAAWIKDYADLPDLVPFPVDKDKEEN